jgi:glutamate carboxypeptidase
MGFDIQVILGRHRLIKGRQQHRPRILLLTHIDTVHRPDSGFLHYQPQDQEFVRGPGIGDMKGGVVMALWAMQALRELGVKADIQMSVSADEEIGSPTIRDWYLSGKHEADYAIGMEPGFPQGPLTATVPMGVVHARKGSGFMHFRVKGQSAHAGGAWEHGLSAIEAVAQRITRIHALSDFERGITTNVGVVQGGTTQNTVADLCEAQVNYRFFTQADGQALRQAIFDIVQEKAVYNPVLDRWEEVEILDEVVMPAMEASAHNQVLVDAVLEEANYLGQNVVPIKRGGGSDTNYMNASGVPAICGMGAPAEGIHTANERIHLPLLFQRLELLIRVLAKLSKRHTLQD